MARHGPHQVAQKSTSTGLSDFKTSWSKFASVTSTIPLPAIFFLLAVTSFVAGRSIELAFPGPSCLPKCSLKRDELIIAALTIGCTSREVRRKSDRRSGSVGNDPGTSLVLVRHAPFRRNYCIDFRDRK